MIVLPIFMSWLVRVTMCTNAWWLVMIARADPDQSHTITLSEWVDFMLATDEVLGMKNASKSMARMTVEGSAEQKQQAP